MPILTQNKNASLLAAVKRLGRLEARALLQRKHSNNQLKLQRRNNMEKRFSKVVKNPETGRTRTVKFGQAGKAKDGTDRIKPGTSHGDSYCSRSYGIKKRLPKSQQNDPNTPNNLSRKKWACVKDKSVKK